MNPRTIKKGIWKNNQFNYATPKAIWVAFHRLSNAKRKLVQKELSDYGFYKSSIDGLYGPGTSKALSAYNKRYLANADLSQSANAIKLLEALSGNTTIALVRKKNCSEDVKVCTKAQLCTQSTTRKNGIKVWDTKYQYKKYVTEAKRRGLSCGVTQTVAKKVNPYSNLPDCPSSTDVIWTNCFATYTGKEGGTYEGEWKDDEYHGMGTYTYPDGTEYVGQFKKQEFDGKGTLTTAEGSKYVGSFLKDKFHGKGTLTFLDGTKYIGAFLDGQFHGKGNYTFGSKTENAGDVYVGMFKEDKFHGKGIYTRPPELP